MLQILSLMMISMKIPSISTLVLTTTLMTSPALAQPQIEQTRFEISSQASIALNSVEVSLKERISDERIRTIVLKELSNLSEGNLSNIKSFILGNGGDKGNLSIIVTFKDNSGSKAIVIHFSPEESEKMAKIGEVFLK